MAEQFARLDELARSLQSTIDALSKDGLGSLSAGIDRLGNAIGGLEEKTHTATTAMSGDFDNVAAAIATAPSLRPTLSRRPTTMPPQRPAASRQAPTAAGCLTRGARSPRPYARVASERAADEAFDSPDEMLRLTDGGGGGIPLSSIGGYTLGGIFSDVILPLAEFVAGVEPVKSAAETQNNIRQTLMGINIDPDSAAAVRSCRTRTSPRRPHRAPSSASKKPQRRWRRRASTSFSLVRKASRNSPKFTRSPAARRTVVDAWERLAGARSRGWRRIRAPVRSLQRRSGRSRDEPGQCHRAPLRHDGIAGDPGWHSPDQAIAGETRGAAEQIFGATTRVGTGYSQFLLGALHVGGGINVTGTRQEPRRETIRRSTRNWKAAMSPATGHPCAAEQRARQSTVRPGHHQREGRPAARPTVTGVFGRRTDQTADCRIRADAQPRRRGQHYDRRVRGSGRSLRGTLHPARCDRAREQGNHWLPERHVGCRPNSSRSLKGPSRDSNRCSPTSTTSATPWARRHCRCSKAHSRR